MSPKNLVFSIFPLLLLLFSCAYLPKKADIRGQIATPSLQETVHNTAPLFPSVEAWPQEEWWLAFQSDELSLFICEALQCNPSLQAARERIQEAKQASIITRAKLFPYVSFDGTFIWDYLSKNGIYEALNPLIPQNSNLIDLDLNMNYEIDFWGKNAMLVKAAVGKVRVEIAEYRQAALEISTLVAINFFVLKSELVQYQLQERIVQLRKQLLELERLREEKALSNRLAVLRASQTLKRAEQMLILAKEEAALSKDLLNRLVGRGPDSCLTVEAALPDLPVALFIPKELSIHLSARRPDLMARIFWIDALSYSVGAAYADFFPNINLSALVGLESVTYTHLFDLKSGTFGAIPAFHLPLFTAGAIQANVDQKRAELGEAIAEYNNKVLQSVQEIADQLNTAAALFQQRERQDLIVSDAEEEFTLHRDRYSQGIDTLFSCIESEVALLMTEIDQLELKSQQYVAAIRLIKALGGGYGGGC